MKKTLSVSAIENGTVIDHIKPGQALRIIQMLKLLQHEYQVTVGFNLGSERIKHKDLIKIEDHCLTKEDADKIMIFAPEATINIIQNFEVVEKIITHLPSQVTDIFICSNINCISNSENISTFFKIQEQSHKVKLICHFCEKTFDRNNVKVKIA